MASIVTRTGKRGKLREIQFTHKGKRRVVHVGRCTRKQADKVRMHIEALLAQSITGQTAAEETQRWLADRSDDMYDRIARTGLCERRGVYGVVSWVDRCLEAKQASDASSTQTRRKQARRLMLEHFTADRDLRTITPGDADDFEAYLIRRGLAEGTIRKRLADVSAWFSSAVRHKLIPENPFADIKTSVPATKSHAYITKADAERVMDELPNTRLRLIFALARWGGLRTPSEPAGLLWSNVDWAGRRFSFVDVKRSRKSKSVIRTVPIFSELIAPLQEHFDHAPEGVDEVFPGMSTNSSALIAPIERAIRLAGVERWPRLLQNLRASRETELVAEALKDGRDIKGVCAWIGNSPDVAMKHYLMVRDSEADIVAVTNPQQNPQHPAAPGASQSQQKTPLTTPRGRKRGYSVAPEGLEQDSQGIDNA